MTDQLETSDLERVADDFRRALLRRDKDAATEMVRRYGGIWQRIKVELAALEKEIALARKNGEAIDLAWLLRERRLERLQVQVASEMRGFAAYADTAIAQQQIEAAMLADAHALTLVETAAAPLAAKIAGVWDHLAAGAIQEIVGATRDGTPLRGILDRVGAEASAAAQDALIQGVALGQSPRETARGVRRAMGKGLSNALRISRTETLRAYREATRVVWQQNDQFVKGWQWRAACDGRTCAMCWAMHGTIHRMDERLDDHPNGRCQMMPVLRSWDEIGKALGVDMSGMSEDEVEQVVGSELFEKAGDDVQRRVLGTGYDAWKSGKVTLQDFVGRKRSQKWGTMRYAKSVRAILGEKAD